MESMRINKYLASRGICSRRKADELIADGSVLVNGSIPTPGMQVSDTDEIKINGIAISNERPEVVVLAYNKPVGVICSSKIQDKSDIILDDAINYPSRVFPIGRLDKNSEGLLLLTNDGALAESIMKAGNYHEKEYIVTVDSHIDDSFIRAISSGVTISFEDGSTYHTRKCKASIIDHNSFSIILTEGKNRQIRRMCTSLGKNVLKLKRIRVMNITLDKIESNNYRALTFDEISALRMLTQQ